MDEHGFSRNLPDVLHNLMSKIFSSTADLSNLDMQCAFRERVCFGVCDFKNQLKQEREALRLAALLPQSCALFAERSSPDLHHSADQDDNAATFLPQ